MQHRNQTPKHAAKMRKMPMMTVVLWMMITCCGVSSPPDSVRGASVGPRRASEAEGDADADAEGEGLREVLSVGRRLRVRVRVTVRVADRDAVGDRDRDRLAVWLVEGLQTSFWAVRRMPGYTVSADHEPPSSVLTHMPEGDPKPSTGTWVGSRSSASSHSASVLPPCTTSVKALPWATVSTIQSAASETDA